MPRMQVHHTVTKFTYLYLFCFWVLQFCTIPLDTAKVRLQLQRKTSTGDGSIPKYRGLLGTVATIAREEGLAALWKGITAGLHRQFIYGGLRIGLYEPVCYVFNILLPWM